MDGVKLVHVSAVVLSISGFFLRGLCVIAAPRLLDHSWVRRLPHVVDTVLLGSALLLAFQIGQYPFVSGWLTAKVGGLLLYIALGMVALRYGQTQRIRITAWLAALAVFAWIVSVAHYHHPAGLFGRWL